MAIVNSSQEIYHRQDWSLTIGDIPDSTYSGEPIQYDQDVVDAYSCFFMGPVSCVSDLYGVRIPKEDILASWENLKASGKYVPGVGGKFVDGVDEARRLWNRLHPDRPVASYRITFDGPHMRRAMNAGHSAVIGERVNSKDVKEILSGGVLENDLVGSGSWGHCVKSRKFYGVIDQYPSKLGAHNIYRLDDLQKKFDNSKVFRFAYIFLPV